MYNKKSLTNISHEILLKYIKHGDIVVDATSGTGNDSLFLSKLVGEHGKVYSFDIQQQAIDLTEKLLYENNISNVKLIHDSHSNFNCYINENINGVIFNLGYLPAKESDKTIITQGETTVSALIGMIDKLANRGIIVIVCYYGHDGGLSEKQMLERYLETIQSPYLVSRLEFVNRGKCPPLIYTIEK